MKYTEININKKLYGEEYMAYDWRETEREIHIYLKSQTHIGECPKCGVKSQNYHATCKRIIQSVPIRMKTTYLQITAYKYKCMNNECSQKVFMEKLSFAPARRIRTTELESIILALSIFMSNEGASKVLKLMGVKISGDTIKRIYDKIPLENDTDIEEVGIDEVAIRKGQKYATAIYDLNDHHLVALLDGKDADTLKEWLKNHTKIKTVARDRASAYAIAINEILPECMQVADRFHLIANLIGRMREIFKYELPNEILVKDGKILNVIPEKLKVLKTAPDSEELRKYHYDNEIPQDKDENPITYDRGLHVRSEQYRKQAESRKKNKN